MSTTLGLKIDPALKRRLTTLAKKRDRPAHWLAKTALVEFLDREERDDAERAEVEARWDHFVLTGAHVPHGAFTRTVRGMMEEERRANRTGGQPGAARRGAALLARHPESGRFLGGQRPFREWPVRFGAGAHVLQYRVTDDAVVLLRVFHSRAQR